MSRSALNRQMARIMRGGAVETVQTMQDPFAVLDEYIPEDSPDFLAIYGNTRTMNMEGPLASNIVISKYFKFTLLPMSSLTEWLEEAEAAVQHVQAWEPGVSSRTPSKAIQLVFRLAVMRITAKQLHKLLAHDNLHVRAIACLYLRFTWQPADLWSWLGPLIDDATPYRPWNPNGTPAPFGQGWLRLLVEEERYGAPGCQSTLLPRIPVNAGREMAVQLALIEKDGERARSNEARRHELRPGAEVKARFSEDGKWYPAVIDRAADVNEGGRGRGANKWWVTYTEFGNSELRSLGQIEILATTSSSGAGAASSSWASSHRHDGGRIDDRSDGRSAPPVRDPRFAGPPQQQDRYNDDRYRDRSRSRDSRDRRRRSRSRSYERHRDHRDGAGRRRDDDRDSRGMRYYGDDKDRSGGGDRWMGGNDNDRYNSGRGRGSKDRDGDRRRSRSRSRSRDRRRDDDYDRGYGRGGDDDRDRRYGDDRRYEEDRRGGGIAPPSSSSSSAAAAHQRPPPAPSSSSSSGGVDGESDVDAIRRQIMAKERNKALATGKDYAQRPLGFKSAMTSSNSNVGGGRRAGGDGGGAGAGRRSRSGSRDRRDSDRRDDRRDERDHHHQQQHRSGGTSSSAAAAGSAPSSSDRARLEATRGIIGAGSKRGIEGDKEAPPAADARDDDGGDGAGSAPSQLQQPKPAAAPAVDPALAAIAARYGATVSTASAPPPSIPAAAAKPGLTLGIKFGLKGVGGAAGGGKPAGDAHRHARDVDGEEVMVMRGW